ALGEMECAGFWDHGKPDKDGIWTKNAPICPTLVQWAKNVEANFGRVRIIKLNPNTYKETDHNLHLDDNNRLNPDAQGWVGPAWLFRLCDAPLRFLDSTLDTSSPGAYTMFGNSCVRQLLGAWLRLCFSRERGDVSSLVFGNCKSVPVQSNQESTCE